MTGIGGGGRCVIRMSNGESIALNFEPMTPGKENPFEPDPERVATMYKVNLGRPATKDHADIFGYKAAAIPGFVKGMCHLVDEFGSMDLDILLGPAIKYAEEGYILDTYIAKNIAFNMRIIDKFPETASILLKDGYPPSPWGGARWDAGYDKLTQKDLAESLRKIAKDGPDAFYKGDIATSIAEDMEKNGGYINETDLAEYNFQTYEPSKGSYRGYELVSLPVSTTIMQILHILDNFDMEAFGHNTIEAIHVLAEAIKLAFAGRETFLGWSAKNPPFRGIISKEYARELAGQINLEKAIDNIDLGNPMLFQEGETTHACAVDKDRNIAGVHSSLGDAFGCKVTIRGTGIILNNKM